MYRILTTLMTAAWLLIAAPGLAASDELHSPEDQLAIAALEGLMAAPPDRALPLLRKVLAGQRSDAVKRRALFVLSQIDEPEAQQLLLSNAGSGSLQLRQEAIRAIGIGGHKDSLQALSTIYAEGEAPVREAVLEAWMIADQHEQILQVAMSASSEAEVERAVALLGAMEATDALRQLLQAGKGGDSLVQAFAIADDLDSLSRMAADGGDVERQVAAVQAIGIVGNADARRALQQIYRDTDSAQVRSAALQGMLIADDEDGVLALYRASNDPEEKQQLLRTLTIIGGDAALEAIDAALEGRL